MNTLTRNVFSHVDFDPMEPSNMKIVLDGKSKKNKAQAKAIYAAMIRVSGDAYPNPAFVELEGGVTIEFINNRNDSFDILFVAAGGNVKSTVSTEEFNDIMDMVNSNAEKAD